MQAEANMNMGMPNCSILFIEYDTQRVNIRRKKTSKKYGRNVFDAKRRNAPKFNIPFKYILVQT